jgi:hypothetical protein
MRQANADFDRDLVVTNVPWIAGPASAATRMAATRMAATRRLRRRRRG